MTVEELQRDIEEQTQLGHELEEFAGQWVATIGRQVVANANTLEALVESLTEEQQEESTILQVPEQDTGVCFY